MLLVGVVVILVLVVVFMGGYWGLWALHFVSDDLHLFMYLTYTPLVKCEAAM